MKTFDEYLMWSIDNSTSDMSARFIMQIAGEQFRIDYLASKQPDPLAEWKALEPGRKVLEIETKDILRVGNKDKDGLFLQRSNYHELDMFTWEKLNNGYQVLHEGPFDAGKLKVGEYAWCNIDKRWIRKNEDGHMGVHRNSEPCLFFSPPDPPSREERIGEAAADIMGLIAAMKLEMTTADFHKDLRTILTELMEEKP